MNLKTFFLLLLVLCVLLPATAAGMGSTSVEAPGMESTPAEDDNKPAAVSMGNKYEVGNCFIRNNCRGNPHDNVGSKEDCARCNGASWINEEGRCIGNLDLN